MIDPHNVYPDATEWAVPFPQIIHAMAQYADSAADIVMAWMHAPILYLGVDIGREPVFLCLGHIFLLALLIAVYGYIRRVTGA